MIQKPDNELRKTVSQRWAKKRKYVREEAKLIYIIKKGKIFSREGKEYLKAFLQMRGSRDTKVGGVRRKLKIKYDINKYCWYKLDSFYIPKEHKIKIEIF